MARLLGPADARPRAILFRQIATPNYELRQFLRLCRRRGFAPIILSYHRDRMSCQNPSKRALVAPMFINSVNRHGQPVFRRERLINVETVEKLRLSEIRIGNHDLPAFHAALMRLAIPAEPFTLVEASSWLGSYPQGAKDYYVELFLGLTDGVMLLEDFITDPKEADFFDRIVKPAFDLACRQLGKRPAIARLCNNRRSDSPLWYAYPDSYRAHFAALGCPL